jgi:hypothetical protein
VLSGTGGFLVHRSLVARDYADVPPAAPVIARPDLAEHLDTTALLLPGEVAFYQVFGRACGQ